MNKLCGIYAIYCTENNKVYIGQSTSIARRWVQHRRDLKGNYHTNTHLQNAWNLYGKSAFKFVVLDCCAKEELTAKEGYFLSLFEKTDTFNLQAVSEHCEMSDELKEKLSRIAKGRIFSEKHRKNLSEAHKGKKHTEEWKKGMSERMKGNKNGLGYKKTPKQLINHSNARTGSKHSPETLEKLRIAAKKRGNKGRWTKR